MNSEVYDKLETVENLPTLPDVIMRLTSALEDPNLNADKVGGIIQDDPSMMTKILKTVNSAIYALPQEIISISQATALLGFIAVKNIALSTSVATVFDVNERSNFKQDEFWKRSICVGIAMNVLYKRIKSSSPRILSNDVIHLAGLVHGIGIITMEQYFHIKFIMAMRIAQNKNICVTEAQAEVFQTDYCELGAWLGEKWNLPEPVLDTIRWHANPSAATQNIDLVNLCHMANYICASQKLGDYGAPVPKCDRMIWMEFGLEVSDIAEIVDEIVAETKQSETLLAVMKE